VKKLQSVSVILFVCTGVLVLMLVTLFTIAAKQHFDNRQAASHRLSIATIAQQFVEADEYLRDERGAMDIAYRSGHPIAAFDLERIVKFRSRSRAALAALTALLKTKTDVLSTEQVQRIARLQLRYEMDSARMSDTLRLSAQDRSPAIFAEWGETANALIATFENEVIALSLRLSGIDSFIDEMMKAGNILVTEVKGGPSIINNAFKQMDTYVTDHERIPPAIPFLSLVTNRVQEPDTSKWITRIYYPVR